MTDRIDRRRALALGAGLAALAPAPSAFARKPTRTPAAAAATLTYPIKLSGNENPWGPGPAARAALAASADEACRYGMSAASALIDAIAQLENVPKDRIVLGSGSGELLHVLATAYCERGQIVCAWPTFNQLMGFADRLGCETKRVPLDTALRHDLGAMSAAVTPNVSLVYVCNPNNPTGTVIAGPELRAFVREMARSALVVSDEAYLDLVEPGSTESMVDLVRADHNVVVLRTFSKIHGLAGLRVGYALARPDIAQRLRRWSVTTPCTLSLRAATASLGDTAFLERTRRALLDDRRRLCDACDELGLKYASPQGNFVFVDVGMPADDFRRRMDAERIQVGRTFEPLTTHSRISVGTTAETTALIAAMRKTFAKQG